MPDKMTESKAREIIKIHIEGRCICDPTLSCEFGRADGYMERMEQDKTRCEYHVDYGGPIDKKFEQIEKQLEDERQRSKELEEALEFSDRCVFVPGILANEKFHKLKNESIAKYRGGRNEPG